MFTLVSETSKALDHETFYILGSILHSFYAI